MAVSHDEIARLAKQIWECEGRQAGRDMEYWLRAEGQLLSNQKRPSNRGGTQATTVAAPSHGTSKAIRLPASIAKIRNPT
jgi:hypothetical protein